MKQHTEQEKERHTLKFKDIDIKNILEIGKLQYNSVRSSLDIHKHKNAIEICYLSRGKQTYEVNGKKFRLNGGDLFITQANQEHSTANEPEDISILYWTQIIPKFIDNKFLNLTGNSAKYIISELNKIKIHKFRGNKEVELILNNILSLESETDKILQKIYLENSYITLLLEVLKCFKKSNIKRKDERIIKLQNYIAKNIKNDITISTLANFTNLSESHLKAVFRDELGLPPGEYILRKKIEEAKKLLKNTTISITNIAFDLSFSTSQYFATVFKQYTNTTPRNFRKENNKKLS